MMGANRPLTHTGRESDPADKKKQRIDSTTRKIRGHAGFAARKVGTDL